MLYGKEIYPLVIAAPMAGISDRAFRDLAREMGCGFTFTEMISAEGLVRRNPKTGYLLDIEGESAVGVQLFGRDPQVLAQAAQKVEAAGAILIDINMGCPTPKIVKNGAGAALMLEPQRVYQIVMAVVKAVALPVTVKLRKAWAPGCPDASSLAKLAASAGAAAVTIHGRTREEFFKGQADWEIVAKAKQETGVPVVGNGDVRDGKTALQMLHNTNCDAVMIGRAACGNPWIFQEVSNYLRTGQQLSPPTLGEVLRVARRHLHLMCRYKGEERTLLDLRKHLAWYTRGAPRASLLRQQFHKAKSVSCLDALLQEMGHSI